MLQHRHLIVRAEVNNPLSKVSQTNLWLKKLVDILNMKILLGPYSVRCEKENNEGITSIAAIETSHIALHIWDNISPAVVQLDVYTCGELNENHIFNHMKIMEPIKIEWKYIDRVSSLVLVKKGSI